MGLLTIIYWVLLVLVALGAFASPEWTWYPRASALVTLALFVIIGIKFIKPTL